MEKSLSPDFVNFCIVNDKKTIDGATLVLMSYDKGLYFAFDTEEDKNVVNISGCYIPLYEQFFEKLFVHNYLSNTKYLVTERQYPTKTTYSGIMIDIDAYTTRTETNMYNGALYEIIRYVAGVIKDTLILPPDFVTYAPVVKKPMMKKMEKPVERDGKEVYLYKDGLHILFPGVKVQYKVKKLILNRCKDYINKYLSKQWGYDSQIEAFDEASGNVPVRVYGSIWEEERHELVFIYKVSYSDFLSIVPLPNSEFAYEKIKNGKSLSYKLNISKELSLHYNGTLIKKYKLDIKPDQIGETVKISHSNISIPSAHDDRIKITKTIASMTQSDPIAKELIRYLDIISINRGKRSSSGKNPEWENICKNILTINLDYRPIAIYFSIRCDETNIWEKNGLAALSSIEEEIKTRSNCLPDDKYQAIARIRSYAKIDSPEQYNSVEASSLSGKIKAALNDFGSEINSDMIAKIITSVYDDRFFYIRTNIAGLRSAGYWLVYITERIAKIDYRYAPFIYKYFKTYSTPKELDGFISQDIAGEFRKLAEQTKYIEEQLEKDERAKLRKRSEKLNKIVFRLGEQTGINGVIQRLSNYHFLNENILFSLDEKKYSTLGVGNGIIVFDQKNYDFICEQSIYKITRTTKTRYIPYDRENENVKKLEKIISEIMPDELERKCILMAISQSLVYHQAGRYMHFYMSNGSSGKSLICKLLHNVLGIKADSRYCDGYGYSFSVNPGVFMKTKNDPNSADVHLVNLEGMMVVTANEAGQGDIKSEIFKALKDPDPKRKLYGETNIIDFPGIVIMSINQELSFTKYDYGFSRRILFYNFPVKFVYPTDPSYDPKANNPRIKLRDDSLIRWAEQDEGAAEAMLSILLHHWLELQNKYEGNLDKIMLASKVWDQTMQFIARHSHLDEFIKNFVKIDEQSKGKVISLSIFCSHYAIWLSKKLQKTFSGENFISEVCNSVLEKYVVHNNTGSYITDIRIESY